MLARFSQLLRSVQTHTRRHWPKTRAGSLLSFFILGFVVMGVLGFVSPVYGQSILKDVVNAILQGFSTIMFVLARLFIGLTIFFLKFFIEVAKYNNFIDTSTVKVGWFLIRDVANMFFVVILLVISFGTILGIEQYEWKKTLGKLILAAVFINFSNMIAQLIIDAAHVFTITFVNAISATAGGNIIRMFNIDTIYSITGAESFEDPSSDLRIETFAASVTAFFLSFLMMATIGAYAIVMVARMVVLWVLIILSPLAYIFQVLPQTQKYAQEWWSEFINHVIVAPVMVFFLWLSFATLGNGNADHGIDLSDDNFEEATQATKKLSISEASSWENMANYLIAIAFLFLGLRKVRELGVEAGGLTSSVTGFAKKAAVIATGYALGRAVYEKGFGAVKKGGEATVGFGLKKVPLGGEFWDRRARDAKAWAGRRNARRNIKRNTATAALEKQVLTETNPLKKAGLQARVMGGRFFGEISGGLVGETRKRADKRTKDWEVGLERLREAEEESYSTSSTRGGQFKTQATVQKIAAQEMAEAKGAQKVAEMQQKSDDIRVLFETEVNAEKERLVNGGMDKKQALIQAENNVLRDGKKLEAIKEEFLSKYDPKERQKQRVLMDRGGGVRSMIALGGDRDVKQKTMAKAMSQKEEDTQNLEYKKDLAVAEARDTVITKKGESPRFVRLAQQQYLEKKDEQLAGLNYREKTESAKHQQTTLQELRKKGNVSQDDLRRAIQNNFVGFTSTVKEGTEFGDVALNHAAETLGLDELRGDSVESAQQHILSYFLGKKVELDKIKEAYEEFLSIVGEDQGHNMMRQADTALKAMATDGGTLYVGAFSDSYDAAKGKTTYSPSEQTEYEGLQEYWAQEITASKLTGIADMTGKKQVVREKLDKDGNEQKAFVMSIGKKGSAHFKNSLKMFEQAFGGITLSTSLHQRLLGDLEGSLISDDKKVFDATRQTREDFMEMFLAFNEKNKNAGGILGAKLESVFNEMFAKMEAKGEITSSDPKKKKIEEIIERGRTGKSVRKP